MKKYEIKEKVANTLARTADLRLYTQQLRDDLTFVGQKNNNTYNIICIVNENEKKWRFTYKDFLKMMTPSVICVFLYVEDNSEEYYILSFKELIELNNISFEDFIKNKDKDLLFIDEEKKFIDNWKIFE